MSDDLPPKFQFQPGPVLMPGHAPLKFHPFANLFPMLTENRRESFRDSLAREQLHPITLHKGMVLDGRNRYRELTGINKPINARIFIGDDHLALDYVIFENLERRDLTDRDRTIIAGDIGKLKLGANRHTREAPQICGPSLFEEQSSEPVTLETSQPPLSAEERARMMNVKLRGVEKVDAINTHGTEELRTALKEQPISLDSGEAIARLPAEEQKAILAALPRDETGKLTAGAKKEVLEVAKTIRKEQNDKRRGERSQRIREIAEASRDLPTGQKFPLIYWDPPTEYEAGDSDRSTENHYPTMTEEEIAALPISELAADDCVMMMWTTVAWLRKTIRLIEGFGFEYKSAAFWDKQHIGLGFWWRDQVEILITATRGKPVAPENGSVLGPSLYSEKKGRHSAKPVHFRDRIDAVPEWKDWPKVELFARGTLPGNWKAWGNEARLTEQQSLGIETSEAAE